MTTHHAGPHRLPPIILPLQPPVFPAHLSFSSSSSSPSSSSSSCSPSPRYPPFPSPYAPTRPVLPPIARLGIVPDAAFAHGPLVPRPGDAASYPPGACAWPPPYHVAPSSAAPPAKSAPFSPTLSSSSASSGCSSASACSNLSSDSSSATSHTPDQQPTYIGHVKTATDAILLLSACDLPAPAPPPPSSSSDLPVPVPPRRVTRRLLDGERAALVRSGAVFVWDEKEAGMRRWTDGRCWSASRVSGSFLSYRELEVKTRPGGSSLGPPTTNQYKPDGLVKQSFSITTASGRRLHVISYFTRRDVREGRLGRVSDDPCFRFHFSRRSSSSSAASGATVAPERRWEVTVDEVEYPDPITRAGEVLAASQQQRQQQQRQQRQRHRVGPTNNSVSSPSPLPQPFSLLRRRSEPDSCTTYAEPTAHNPRPGPGPCSGLASGQLLGAGAGPVRSAAAQNRWTRRLSAGGGAPYRVPDRGDRAGGGDGGINDEDEEENEEEEEEWQRRGWSSESKATTDADDDAAGALLSLRSAAPRTSATRLSASSPPHSDVVAAAKLPKLPSLTGTASASPLHARLHWDAKLIATAGAGASAGAGVDTEDRKALDKLWRGLWTL